MKLSAVAFLLVILGASGTSIPQTATIHLFKDEQEREIIERVQPKRADDDVGDKII